MAKRGRPSLSGVSSSSLQAELERRQKKHAKLYRKHAELLGKLHTLEAKISAAGGSIDDGVVAGGGGGARRGAVRGRKRAKNAMNLADALAKVLKNRTMGVTEVAAAVQKAGYRTTSKTFRTIVNQALIKHTDRFKKVERGQYTAA